jgi:murein DD-endopeptidase MepM/ murein hydrolase activator NlpD
MKKMNAFAYSSKERYASMIADRCPNRGRKRNVITAMLLSLPVAGLIALSSCTTTGTAQRSDAELQTAGVWHRVQEGQTLWRIAKTYRVSLEEIKDANDIQDVVHVAKGTWLHIPGASKLLYVQGNADSNPEIEYDPGFVWPVQGDIVSSFGKTANDYNYGIDIRSSRNQDVVATLEGTVVLAGTIRGYGTTIIIEHENNFCSLYAKNIKSLVKEGQRVNRNGIIARAGANATAAGDTVHYELFYRGKPVNPLYYLP